MSYIWNLVETMEMKHGSDGAKMFFSNISLITSNGKWGQNVMTAEWVHHVSYTPAIIIISIHGHDATAENIMESKEFGVNIASEEQVGLIGVAGHSTGKEVDKFSMLKELGVEYYKAKEIDTHMIKGASLNLECKLLKQEKMGDHIIFAGEVVAMSIDNDAKPLLFRAATGFFKTDVPVPHPTIDKSKMEKLLEKYKN
jgi:flavin reductase (DIM6/NTAB) family NADH-FMN oxidoreductase RutF